MTAAELATRLEASARESKVALRHAAACEPLPEETVTAEVAHVVADAVVADSGAIVLCGGDRRLRPILGARSLVAHATPRRIVETYGEALARFSGEGRMISICGPSRTADIEKTLVVGVHGPCEVTIVLHPGDA